MPAPTADVSVRVAWADDAPAIAAVQLRAWPELYAGVLPPDALPAVPRRRGRWPRPGGSRWPGPATPATGCSWRSSATGSSGSRSPGPAGDPDCDPVVDGELQELTVDPAERGRGHGSRLLQAAADTMVADRFTRAVTWVLAADDDAARVPHRRPAGLPTPPTASSTSTAPARRSVKQVRLHTVIS